ncbi:MAG: SPOR domain-containing protein [Alphaproteobacteria bacterium]|nr:SPOR domain-containing protein [Alphaproteobacteria bacterium]
MADEHGGTRGAGVRLPRRFRLGRGAALAVAALVAVLAASIYAYDLGFRHGAKHAPPLIAADPSPTKALPDSPGGIDIPHQDKLVYRRLATAREPHAPVPETLLPPPEEPLPKPREEPAPGSPSAAKAAPKPKPAVATEPAERTAVGTPAARADEAAAYRLQLGSFRTPDAARAGWKRVLASHRGLLEQLPHRIARVDLGAGGGTYHRLQVGAFASRGGAAALCRRLKAAGQDCLVVGR